VGEDDRTPNYPGLSEEDFDRLERVKTMADAALLDAWRKLSNARVVTASPWLAFLEAEIRERGLLPPN
jgi:hypothetical protein